MNEAAMVEEYGEEAPKYDAAHWDKELSAWEKRTEKWHKEGERTVDRFLSNGNNVDQEVFRLNLFHTHITTLMSMLYGKVPQVDVSRRHADQNDDVGRVAAETLDRMLNTDIEEAGENFSSVLKGCLQDRLLPGLGTARVRYEVETETVQVEAVTDMYGVEVQAAYEDTRVVSEEVDFDYIYWRDFAWSYARNWGEVEWVAFRTRIKKPEAIKRFGKIKAELLKYSNAKPQEESGHNMEDSEQTAAIWEIWCKTSKTTYWFQKGMDSLLDHKDDPLRLEGFFPCPPPMIANQTTRLLLPVPDYKMAQDLYTEVDLLQTRISRITTALKVVGVYDSKNVGVSRMLTEGFENQLIPVDNWAMFAEQGGIKGAVDWFPIETVANTLDRLRAIRNETIQLLYQVSGLQDMMQGSLGGGQPSSATEQALRARFSSVRVQYLQDDFARFASNLQTLKAEVVSKHFDPETILKQSRLLVTPDANMAGQAIALIKSPDVAKWSIEIRPESIAMIDYAQLKSERTEYLTALSTFLQSAQAMGKVAPSMGPMLMELLKWGLAGFKGSSEIEGVIDRAMSQLLKDQEQAKKQPQPPSPEQIKMQGQMQKQQFDMQKQQAKFQQDMQKEWAKANAEMQKLNNELQAELMSIRAKTEASITEEAAQAKFNIMENVAKGAGPRRD